MAYDKISFDQGNGDNVALRGALSADEMRDERHDKRHDKRHDERHDDAGAMSADEGESDAAQWSEEVPGCLAGVVFAQRMQRRLADRVKYSVNHSHSDAGEHSSARAREHVSDDM